MSHRDQLLEAAKRLILDNGLAATTARDLVAASGTNLGSIGYHFESLEALLSQALEELFDEWTEVLAQAAFSDPEAPTIQRAATSLRATMATLDEHGALIRAFVEALAYAERSPEFRALMREHYRRIQTTVARLAEDAIGPHAVDRGADPMVISLVLIALFDGLALQYRMAPDETPTGDELVASLAALSPRG